MGRTSGTVIVLCLVGLGWLIYTVPEPAPDTEPSTAEARHQLEGVTFRRTLEDGRVWRLKAPEATRQGKEFLIQDPRVSILQNGDTTMRGRAREAEYWQQEARLRTRGEVRIERPLEQELLCANWLDWNLETERVTTTDGVVTINPQRRLRASGMNGDLTLERVQLQSNVRSQSGSFSRQCSWPIQQQP